MAATCHRQRCAEPAGGVGDVEGVRRGGVHLDEYFTRPRLGHRFGTAGHRLGRRAAGLELPRRMEQRGWVRRTPDPADGRYTLAILAHTHGRGAHLRA